MQGRWHALFRGLAATAGTGGLLLSAGHLEAQTPLSGGSMTPPPIVRDESAKLFAAPKGDVFRLAQTDGDQTGGGGGLVLAVSRPRDAWQTLLEILPPTCADAELDAALARGAAYWEAQRADLLAKVREMLERART